MPVGIILFADRIEIETVFEFVSQIAFRGFEENFHRRFEETGFSFSELLMRTCLMQAEKLLPGTDLPVSTVSRKSGFGNPFHFSGYSGRTFIRRLPNIAAKKSQRKKISPDSKTACFFSVETGGCLLYRIPAEVREQDRPGSLSDNFYRSCVPIRGREVG